PPGAVVPKEDVLVPPGAVVPLKLAAVGVFPEKPVEVTTGTVWVIVAALVPAVPGSGSFVPVMTGTPVTVVPVPTFPVPAGPLPGPRLPVKMEPGPVSGGRVVPVELVPVPLFPVVVGLGASKPP